VEPPKPTDSVQIAVATSANVILIIMFVRQNTENGCDDMCCENFKKLTGAYLRIMIEMLAKASVDLNSDVQSTAKKES